MIVNQIERELKSLWAEMAGTQETPQAVTRACVHNLVIWTADERADSEVTQMIGDITIENPGRIIVLLPAERKQSELSAWVTAQCNLRSGGRKQVCCEQIMVRMPEAEVPKVPSIIRSLLVPDMPVFLWWRAPLMDNTDVLRSLLESSDRVIADSEFSSPRRTSRFAPLKQLASLFDQEGEWTSFSDLTWARVTSWRRAVAELFDLPAYQDSLHEIRSLEIHHRGTEIPSAALLLSGWIGGALQWRGLRVEQSEQHLQILNGTQTISFTSTLRPGSGTEAVSLKCTGNRLFSVSESPDSTHLVARVIENGTTAWEKVFVQKHASEADLMNIELELLGRDRMFEKALTWLNRL